MGSPVGGGVLWARGGVPRGSHGRGVLSCGGVDVRQGGVSRGGGGGAFRAAGRDGGGVSRGPVEPALSGARRDVLKRIDQSEFEGFEYTHPLLLSAEESA